MSEPVESLDSETVDNENDVSDSVSRGTAIREALAAIAKGDTKGDAMSAPEAPDAPDGNKEAAAPIVAAVAPVKEETPAAAPVEPESKAWAKAYKLEAQLRKERDEAKKLKSAVEELEKRFAGVNEQLEGAKKDPLKFAESVGVSAKDWAVQTLKQDMTPEEKIAALEAKLNEQAKASEERHNQILNTTQQRELESTYRNYIDNMNTVLQNPEYDLIRSLGVEAEVLQHAQVIARDTGKVVSPKEAADAVLQGVTAKLQELSKNEAVLKLLNIAKTEPQPPAVRVPTVTTSVTNKVGPSPILSSDEEFDALPKKEQIRRLAAKIRVAD
jgi:hypothetical protein